MTRLFCWLGWHVWAWGAVQQRVVTDTQYIVNDYVEFYKRATCRRCGIVRERVAQ